MTHSDVHLAVRAILRGSPFRGFIVVAESLEDDRGGVFVEWRISISKTTPLLYFHGLNPYDLLAELRSTVEAFRATERPPPDLEAIGAPPLAQAQGDVK